ncbi:hypothetical protein CEUSTIGMA_g3478.t1 [Chlamydomonas eustigma]|uniref:Phospholipase B-like n=1 Tax=Chlamydomonas eustigma TaxID=1157962 RepID=A0A250WZ25_9CHLO|nr:hypothetical protein CEUSTIGMA_g3478.t1 [Chlamydomonas eustigma]|eukprot:GAX76035.1 hypothetical protein CEUSTIGMA_g3478.t1 [Chlamydomonas eustigma]
MVNESDVVASASFSPSENHKSDFAQLRVHTKAGFDDSIQMQAAGFAEGYISAEMINNHWKNMEWWLKDQEINVEKLDAWLWDQDEWTREGIDRFKSGQLGDHSELSFWSAMSLLMDQVDGLVMGYQAHMQEELGQAQGLQQIDRRGFLLLNSFGDIDNLVDMLKLDSAPFIRDGQQLDDLHHHLNLAPGLNPVWETLVSPGMVKARIAKRGHCSAIIKVTADFSDILMGHNTWWSFSSLLRIYKHYSFALSDPVIKSKSLSFSSYPGLMSSMDDWYILDTQMVVTETSNDIYDISLYNLATSQAALSWHRVRVANMLAEDGATWAEYVGTHNSGTYTNQYMLVDLKRFTPYSELQPGLLTVVEVIPGRVVKADTTQELERGYWPSYNVPYFPEVYNATGYNMLRTHLSARGSDFNGVVTGLSYQLDSRAKIMRRDSGTLTDLSDLQRFMRSNGWPSDTLSVSPWDGISARGDLSPDPDDRSADGAYDAKVTNYRLALQMSSIAVNGPTWNDHGLPPFRWAEWKDVAHFGMRDEYRTEWELQEP